MINIWSDDLPDEWRQVGSWMLDLLGTQAIGPTTAIRCWSGVMALRSMVPDLPSPDTIEHDKHGALKFVWDHMGRGIHRLELVTCPRGLVHLEYRNGKTQETWGQYRTVKLVVTRKTVNQIRAAANLGGFDPDDPDGPPPG